MAICQKCGKEYTPNLWGEVGKFVGTPHLCEEHSPEWPVYYATAQAAGVALSAISGYFLAGTPIEHLVKMLGKTDL